MTYSDIALYKNNLNIEVYTQDDLQSSRIPNTKAIAIPKIIAEEYAVENMYEAGIRFYLYGDVTIDDYIACTGIESFESQIPVYNLDKSFSGSYVMRGFSSSQRSAK